MTSPKIPAQPAGIGLVTVQPSLLAGLLAAAVFVATLLAVFNGPLTHASANSSRSTSAFDFTQEYWSNYMVTSFHNQAEVGAPAGTVCDQSGPAGFSSPGQGHVAISHGMIKMNDENYNSGFDVDQAVIDGSGHFRMLGHGYSFAGQIRALPGHTLPAPVEPEKNIYDSGPGPQPVAIGSGTWVSTWATGGWCEPVFQVKFSMTPIKPNVKGGEYSILPITGGPTH